MKRFSHLVQAVPNLISLSGDALITAPVVESDADLAPGGMFVARKGLSTDGHAFIPRAIESGAAAIVGEHDLPNLTVPYARVANAQEATGYLAAAYHDFPARQMVMIGVTGTDGKTTTSTFIHSILQAATGGKAGLISTVAAYLGDETYDTGFHVTTPSGPMLQGLLAKAVANGLTHCVVEMTSHGLAQGRLNGVSLDVAVVTNVTHEHLDYHGSFGAYRAAKARIFELMRQPSTRLTLQKIAVLNADDPSLDFFTPLAAASAGRVIRYGFGERASLHISNPRFESDKTTFDVAVPESDHATFAIRLAGQYNVLNAAAAIGATAPLIEHDREQVIAAGLLNVATIPGRMERVDEGQAFLALVDFAHTPNALHNALAAARQMVGDGGRLIAMFGCAGLRDRDKRHLMAEVATRSADVSIFTAEDPRTESLNDILQTMADAASSVGGIEGQTFIRIRDRGEALYHGCQMARTGDVFIACGKGHEQSMAFGTTEYVWDDRNALRVALQGAPLRTLPTAKTD